MDPVGFLRAAIDSIKKGGGESVIVVFLVCGVYISSILPDNQKGIYFAITIVIFVGLFIYFYAYVKPRTVVALNQDDVVFFDVPKTGGYNEEFYEFFYSRIRDASANIYVTGEGLICRDEHERDLARRLADAYRFALGRGVSITRVQYRTEEDQSYWLKLVQEIHDEYPDKFHVYTIYSNTPQITHICSIDPESNDENYVELMMPSVKLFGPESKPIAGAAVFIKGRQHIAALLRSKILALIEEERC